MCPVAANRSRRRGTSRANHRLPHILYMKATTTPVTEKEPIGIVISRGSRVEHVPAFFAYVWGPAPETPDDVREVQAA